MMRTGIDTGCKADLRVNEAVMIRVSPCQRRPADAFSRRDMCACPSTPPHQNVAASANTAKSSPQHASYAMPFYECQP